MTREKMDDSFFELMSELADDVFLYSEEEVNAQLRELGMSPDDVVKSTKALFGKAMLRHASAKVISNKEIASISASNVFLFPPGAAKAKLEELISRDPSAFPELTLAARKGSSISEEDARSQLEDLIAVGAIKLEDLR